MWPSRSQGTTDLDNGTASLSLTACVREAMEALGSLRRGRAADLVPMDPALQTRIFVMGASVMRPSWGPSPLFWADESGTPQEPGDVRLNRRQGRCPACPGPARGDHGAENPPQQAARTPAQ